MKRTRGFTLAELVVVVGIVILLGLILLMVLPLLLGGGARELKRRAMCATHLRGIGTAIEIYANGNNDQVPILPDIDQSKPIDYTESLRLGPECTAAALGHGAHQNLCLLVKDGSITWEMFLCPSVRGRPADRSHRRALYGLGEVVNGRQQTYIDYALQIPYRQTSEGVNSCPLIYNMDASIPIMADRGPQADLRTRWSPNHGNEGEMVLFADTHVRWSADNRGRDDLNTTGYAGNNIYTADDWGGTPESPTLLSNGTQCKTPTDPEGTKDSVLYHRW